MTFLGCIPDLPLNLSCRRFQKSSSHFTKKTRGKGLAFGRSAVRTASSKCVFILCGFPHVAASTRSRQIVFLDSSAFNVRFDVINDRAQFIEQWRRISSKSRRLVKVGGGSRVTFAFHKCLMYLRAGPNTVGRPHNQQSHLSRTNILAPAHRRECLDAFRYSCSTNLCPRPILCLPLATGRLQLPFSHEDRGRDRGRRYRMLASHASPVRLMSCHTSVRLGTHMGNTHPYPCCDRPSITSADPAEKTQGNH